MVMKEHSKIVANEGIVSPVVFDSTSQLKKSVDTQPLHKCSHKPCRAVIACHFGCSIIGTLFSRLACWEVFYPLKIM
jgi:hypothetical protein